jgi:hypothetical protein
MQYFENIITIYSNTRIEFLIFIIVFLFNNKCVLESVYPLIKIKLISE